MAARTANRLTATAVKNAKARGRYADGLGLYLQVAANGSKSWEFRFKMNGRTRYFGLGALHTIDLADARARAGEARRLIADGIDPIEARRDRRSAARLDEARRVTFEQAAETYMTAHEAGWRNAKSSAQWRSSLKEYAYPLLGRISVADVDTPLVLKVLEKVWTTKPETASRLRGRIERIIDAATAKGQRIGANPARWKGHLSALLPNRDKVRAVKHHKAIPYADMPALMVDLRARDAMAARALEFAILTAARTNEVLSAKWAEIDIKGAVWSVPAEKMKAGRAHRVALSPAAIVLLEELKAEALDDNPHVFPGAKCGEPLSNMAMLNLLQKRMGRTDATPHGLARACFKTWATEKSTFPREIIEAALAHAGDPLEQAYNRGDALDRRRKLMAAWSEFLARPVVEQTATVLPMKART